MEMGLYRHQIRTILWSLTSLLIGLAAGFWIATRYASALSFPAATLGDSPPTSSDVLVGAHMVPRESSCSCEGQHTRSPLAKGMGVPAVDPGSEAALNQYINPTIHGRRSKVKLGSPKALQDEYAQRHKILFGVMTQQNYLPTRAKTLYDTWGSEIPNQLVFYVGEDCLVPQDLQHLPVLKLEGVSDRIYPPLKKAFVAMQHMCNHYLDSYHWFVRGDDDMYANGAKLQDLLMKFDPSDVVVLGRPGVGADADMPRLQLLPHEAYCMGGPGMIFSRGAMAAIRPHLLDCYNAILRHDNRTGVKWHDDDVEIGRCFSRYLDVQCSTSEQALNVFHYDYTGKALSPKTLWAQQSKFKAAITVHPIKQPDNMLSLHHYYKRLEFEESLRISQQLATKVNKICESLPPSLHPPSYPSNCGLSVKSNIVEQTSLLYGPGDLLESMLQLRPQSEMPYVYNQQDRFDPSSSWVHMSPGTVYEVGTSGSAHSVPPGLSTEVRRMISLVAKHENATLKLKEFVSGYTRYSPIGREYILNLKFFNPQSPLELHFRRYRLLRPFSTEVMSVEEHYFGPHPSLNVLLPLVGGGDRLGDFLVSFKAAILEASEKVTLRIVVPDNGLEQVAREAVEHHLGSPSNVFVKKLEGADRLTAIEASMKELGVGSDLVFITDVDTRIQPWFFHTCRSNTVEGKRIYFPTAFWTSELRTPPMYFAWAGDWGHFSYAQVCIYKSDYDKVGGYKDTPYLVTLLERVAEHGMEAMRAPDTGLIHLLPQRTCGDLQRKRQHKCRTLKSLWSIDRPDLADYIIDLEEAKGTPLSYF